MKAVYNDGVATLFYLLQTTRAFPHNQDHLITILVLRSRTFFFGADVSMDYEKDEELGAGKELLQRYLTLDKKVVKTKEQVKSVAGVIEKQTRILAAISSKIKLESDETL